MKRWIYGLVLVAIAAAGPAQALTVEDVIGLTRAGASDSIIMSKIEIDQTVFRLTVNEILELKEAGVSDPVITYMINTGKDAVDPGMTEAAPEYQEEYEEVPEAETEYVEDTGNAYETGVSRDYQVHVSFGSYYPHWPGYWYSYYYDPFWWPSLSYYWVYWHPYPYYWSYFDPWYYCNYSNYRYYDHHYGGHYWHHNRVYRAGHDDSYDRNRKDRHIGNRGPGGDRDRVYKSPNRPDGSWDRNTRTYRPNDPRHDVAETARTPARRNYRPPQNPRAPEKISRPSRGTVRPTPAPAPKRSSKPSRDNPSYKNPSKDRSKVARPAPSREAYKPSPPRSNSVRPADRGSSGSKRSGSRSAPSRSGSRTRKN